MATQQTAMADKTTTQTRQIAPPEEQDFSRGLYWSIAKDDEIVGYLFGTFHSNDPRVLAMFTDSLHAQLKSSYSFSMEAFPGSRYFNPHYWLSQTLLKI